jgi:hypothetical protein
MAQVHLNLISIQFFRLARAVLASLLSAAAARCGSGTEVPAGPLDQRVPSSDTGTVYGQVVLAASLRQLSGGRVARRRA